MVRARLQYLQYGLYKWTNLIEIEVQFILLYDGFYSNFFIYLRIYINERIKLMKCI